jgi:hypothetical protein
MFSINKILHANLKSTSKLWLDAHKVGNKIQQMLGRMKHLVLLLFGLFKDSRKNIHEFFGLF